MHRLIPVLVMTLSATAFAAAPIVLIPDRVFDGTDVHPGWAVVVEGERIAAVGPRDAVDAPTQAEVIRLEGATLLPGLIEGHAHILLHPYDETSWNDQVLKESEAERVARATVHLRDTLRAGFTTVRDLGTEGAGTADPGIRRALELGLIPGPRQLRAEGVRGGGSAGCGRGGRAGSDAGGARPDR